MDLLPPLPLAGPLRAALADRAAARVARLLLARHDLPDDGLAPFADGSDIVWGTPRHVVKLTTPDFAWQIEAEVAMLSHVAGRLPLSTPEAVAVGALEGWPYVVMTRIGGAGLAQVWATLDHRGRRACAAWLGELLAALHSLPPTEINGPFGPFLDDTRQQLAARQRRLGASEAAIADAVAVLDRWSPREADPVVLHTELLGDHVRVTAEGRPCGLLDFADARTGHPDYDLPALVEFIFKGEPGALTATLRGAGRALPDDREDLLGWHLAHRYASLPRLFAAAGDPPSLAEAADRLLAG